MNYFINSNPRRTPMRYTLPADQLEALEAEAEQRRLPLQRYIESVLMRTLPNILFDTMTDYVHRSRATATEPNREQVTA